MHGILLDPVVVNQTGKMQDSLGNGITSTQISSNVRGIDSASAIRDVVNPANFLHINSDGSINVAQQNSSSHKIPINLWYRSTLIAGSLEDQVYTIPVNTNLYINTHMGGSSGKGSSQIWYDNTNAITTNSYLHSIIYLNNLSNLDNIDNMYVGYGNLLKSIILRRQNLDSGSCELFIRMKGYLNYLSYTILDTGTTTSSSATTIGDTKKALATNVYKDKYLMIDEENPLRIISNAKTTFIVSANPNFVTGLPYKIISFMSLPTPRI